MMKGLDVIIPLVRFPVNVIWAMWEVVALATAVSLWGYYIESMA